MPQSHCRESWWRTDTIANLFATVVLFRARACQFSKKLSVLNGSPSRYGRFKLFKTSVVPIRTKPTRCSYLQLVAVRIGSNYFFALRIALRIASQRNGLVRIGRVWRWARNQTELTRRNTVQIRLSLLVVLNRCYWRPGDTMQYNLHHELQRIATDCNVAQRWSETRYE